MAAYKALEWAWFLWVSSFWGKGRDRNFSSCTLLDVWNGQCDGVGDPIKSTLRANGILGCLLCLECVRVSFSKGRGLGAKVI